MPSSVGWVGLVLAGSLAMTGCAAGSPGGGFLGDGSGAERVVKGLPSKAIARELEISYRTVELHRSHIMEKLQVRSVAELIRLIVERRNA